MVAILSRGRWVNIHDIISKTVCWRIDLLSSMDICKSVSLGSISFKINIILNLSPKIKALHNGTRHLVTIDETRILVPNHVIKFYNSFEDRATHRLKSIGTQFLNEFQWLDSKIGHQDGSPNYGHQGDIPYSTNLRHVLLDLVKPPISVCRLGINTYNDPGSCLSVHSIFTLSIYKHTSLFPYKGSSMMSFCMRKPTHVVHIRMWDRPYPAIWSDHVRVMDILSWVETAYMCISQINHKSSWCQPCRHWWDHSDDNLWHYQWHQIKPKSSWCQLCRHWWDHSDDNLWHYQWQQKSWHHDDSWFSVDIN